MVVNKTKKVRKQRRGRTHGWGSPKKHRGAGSRGGRGMAGSGKKGQQKVSKLIATTGKILGLSKQGFKRPEKTVKKDIIINLYNIEMKLQEYLKNGTAKKTKDAVEIDMSKTGYTKVLGYGQISSKMNITAGCFSAKAVEKIEAAGGKAISIEKPDEKKEISENSDNPDVNDSQ